MANIENSPFLFTILHVVLIDTSQVTNNNCTIRIKYYVYSAMVSEVGWPTPILTAFTIVCGSFQIWYYLSTDFIESNVNQNKCGIFNSYFLLALSSSLLGQMYSHCNYNIFSSEERIRNGAKKLLKSRQGTTQGRMDSFFSVISSAKTTKRKVRYVPCAKPIFCML